MNEQRIREIANESSYHAENSVDYYSGIVDGLTWEAKILKARDLKFAELIVRECVAQIEIEKGNPYRNMGDENRYGIGACVESIRRIKQHFGVEE